MSEHFVEVCEHGYVHGQCKCPGPKTKRTAPCPTDGLHAGENWLVWDELRLSTRREHDRPRNVCIWIIGPDTDPQALEIEQSDGNVYLLCKVSECDVMFLGYMVASYARADGLMVRQSVTSKLTHGGG